MSSKTFAPTPRQQLARALGWAVRSAGTVGNNLVRRSPIPIPLLGRTLDLVATVGAAVPFSKESAVELTGTTTIRTSPDDLYQFWRSFDRLPTFMAHLDDVTVTGERTSHWKASAPFGRTVEWDAEITDEDPGRSIAWKSVGSADIDNEGVVKFNPAPRDQGTELHVTIRYDIPAGKLGELVARYFGEDPHQQLDDDLRRLKQVVETGEVVRSDGAPWGKRARKEFPQHAAQPLTDAEAEEAQL